MPSPSIDVFLAHAGADTAAAEQLFDLLAPDVRVWLDARSLLLGDDWPLEISRAQRAAMATVVLVSKNVDFAYYLREEIHTAIALHRAAPGEHRAVAVFLDGRPADPMAVPYGLRILHSLDAVAEGGLPGVAAKLRELVVALRHRGAVATAPSPAASASRDATLPDAHELYDRLCKLTLGAQLEAVIFRAGVPREHIASATASISQRALDVAHFATQGGPAVAARVAAAIAKEAPWLDSAETGAAPARPAVAVPPIAPTRPASVLLVFANPRGTDPLRLGEEERALRQSMKLAAHRDSFEVESIHAATIDDLRRALIAKERSLVHFSGHGTQQGLLFEDEVGRVFAPDPAALAKLLQRRGVETVVLNACYSASIVALSPMGTRYTVAMEGPVGDASAIEFSRGFYDVLGAGGGVREAYEEGLSCADLKGVPADAVLIET